MDSTAALPAPRLGLFATAMLVMGGIVGSGIFMNPHVVAKDAPSSAAVLAAWLLGGAVALAGGFVWAELAGRRPGVGGQYAYLRDGVHPAAGFVYGWSNLLVTQTGGMAAVAVTFARYTHVLVSPRWSEAATAVAALAALTAINLWGVRAGSVVQSVFMVLKIAAIAALVACGLFLAPKAGVIEAAATGHPGARGFFAAMIAVLFAYGGWATATFVSGEIKDSSRTLPRALILGCAGVVALYIGVNAACLRALGPGGLAAFDAPASEVMRRALGSPGATAIAAAIAISTFGFLAQGMLVCPRVYYAMAQDGLFFASVGRLHPRTGVPYVAIALQGVCAIATALSGTYEQILSWVVTVDFAFLALTAGTVFVFRRRAAGVAVPVVAPWQPWTTLFFIGVSMAVVVATFVEHPARSILGWALVAAGLPIYFFWKRRIA
jgi:basic amino acid/polyamine antiporter, APA family